MAPQQILLILVVLQIHWQLVQNIPANSTSTTPEPQTSSSSSTTTSSPGGESGADPTTTTTNSPDKSKEEKSKKRHHAHRLRGGTNQTVPPYISSIWTVHPPRESHDGKLVGLGIKVGTQHTLVHADSWAQVRPGPDTGPRLRVENFIKLNAQDPTINTVQPHSHPTKINVNTGWDKIRMNSGDDIGMHQIKLPDVREKHGPFALLTHDAPGFNKKEHIAPLERDKNNFGNNCQLHGYSILRNTGSGSRGNGDIVDHKPDRHFVSFPVNPIKDKCNNGFCRIQAQNAHTHVCQHTDRGAPIICEGKVTYLAMPRVNNVGCSTTFDAYHVPHLTSRLNI